MKFSDFAPHSSELELVHPSQNKPWILKNGDTAKLTIVGVHSKEYQNALRASNETIAGLDNPTSIIDIFDEIYRKCVIGWNNDEFFECEFSQDEFKKRYWDEFPFLRTQVEESVQENARFFRTLDKPSTETSNTENTTRSNTGKRKHAKKRTSTSS